MVSDNSIPVRSAAALTLRKRDVIESALQILQAVKAGDGDYWGKLDETIAALDEALHLQPDPAAQPSRAAVLEARELPPLHGVSRIADNPCALMLLLKREPTDDDLREIHDVLSKRALKDKP